MAKSRLCPACPSDHAIERRRSLRSFAPVVPVVVPASSLGFLQSIVPVDAAPRAGGLNGRGQVFALNLAQMREGFFVPKGGVRPPCLSPGQEVSIRAPWHSGGSCRFAAVPLPRLSRCRCLASSARGGPGVAPRPLSLSICRRARGGRSRSVAATLPDRVAVRRRRRRACRRRLPGRRAGQLCKTSARASPSRSGLLCRRRPRQASAAARFVGTAGSDLRLGKPGCAW